MPQNFISFQEEKIHEFSSRNREFGILVEQAKKDAARTNGIPQNALLNADVPVIPLAPVPPLPMQEELAGVTDTEAIMPDVRNEGDEEDEKADIEY